jgi:DNA helicase HerA-like ATPase
MIRQDLVRGHGFALIEPHGDLAQEVLDLVPRERIDDVIYLNPGDLEYPVGLNVLEAVDERQHHLVASGVVSIFTHLWPEFWGPRSQYLTKNALYALLEAPGTTLLDVSRMFVDDLFRRRVLARVRNHEAREFWLREYPAYPAALRQEATAPVLNKTGEFRLTPLVRNILGQRTTRFNLREAMDQGKIVVANLSKAALGEDLSALLGSMLLTRLLLAGLSRGDIPPEARRPFFLYIDELATFHAEGALASMLSELRKFAVGVTSTQQFLAQVGDELRGALFGNANSLITFRASAEDADYLEREFRPATTDALTSLDRCHIYAKLSVSGVTRTPFPARTLLLPGPARSHRAEIIERSRARYARPRGVVEGGLRC